MTDAPLSTPTADVTIIGGGPVGLVLALLLADRGRQVVVVERWQEFYPLPRAVAVSHESLRTLVQIGFRRPELLERWGAPGQEFAFCAADGRHLLETTYPRWGESGYAPMYAFSQPELEAELNRLAEAHQNVDVRRGVTATAVRDRGDRVDVAVAEWDQVLMVPGHDRGTIQSDVVAGCDGANSMVREALGLPLHDAGFSRAWFVVDVDPTPGTPAQPYARQHLDPARPTTLIAAGPGHRRFEFMLHADDPADLISDDGAWSLMAPWGVTPQNTTLVRHARYQFEARWLTTWAAGRVVLAGDAAHQMPPFLGQGFNSGIRDAANLAWRLEQIVSGVAELSTLDEYSQERSTQVAEIIEETVRAGELICQTDPELVAARDARLGARRRVVEGRTTWPIPAPRTDDSASGLLSVQAPVSDEGSLGELDRLRDGAPLLLVGARAHDVLLDTDTVERWARSGGRTLTIGHDLHDPDAVYDRWFTQLGVVAVLIRPDFYVFGSAEEPTDVDRLVLEWVTRHGSSHDDPACGHLTEGSSACVLG